MVLYASFTIRSSLKMDISSEKVLPDWKEELSFSSLVLRKELSDNLLSLDFTQMTPIQAQSLPLMLNRTDVIAQAQTGSGKTVAFGLGVLNHLKTERVITQALILCPTRELAEQVSQVLRRLARLLPNIKILNLSGGTPIKPQYDSLRHGAHIIVGTPGRVQKHLDQKSLSLSRLNTLVLDEADRMLDMGFADSLRQILSYCPSKKQTWLFSATFTPLIKQLAQEFMHHPQEVKAEEQESVQDIEQRFFEVPSPNDKYSLLKKLLTHYRPASTLIFCNTREKTQELAAALNHEGFSAAVINGDLEQAERDQAIIQFGNGSRCILVATDVAARGLDIKELPAVINYELAFEAEVHIHRIGRTGRAGCKGLALSITTPKDAGRLCAIEELMATEMVWGREDELTGKTGSDQSPGVVTLRLMAGRKDKIRPGDILGALTKDAGLKAEAIGKIDILSSHSYVAIERSHAGKAFEQFQKGKIKGKKVGVQRLP